jgi:ribosomal protein S3
MEEAMRNRHINDILREWKAESGVTHLMLYRLNNGVLTVYTDRPGPLIGFRGTLIDKYIIKLKFAPFCNITEVRIEETDGIF